MSSKPDVAPEGRPPRRVPSRRPGPVGGKRDQNRRRRTNDLCRAGLALFLERGVADVTVDEIARAAGTAKGNFYRYLEDKADLVAALLEPFEQAFDEAFDTCERTLAESDSASALIMAYNRLALDIINAVQADVDLTLLYLQEARGPAVGPRAPLVRFAGRITERTVALTEVAHRHKLLRQIPPRVSALAVIGAVERLLLAHLKEQPFENEAAIAGSLVTLVMQGLVAR